MRYVSTLAVMCLLLAMPLFAGDGRIPIWEPTTITEPGSYVVTRNISASSGAEITVGSDNVNLDLNGFAVGRVYCDGKDGFTVRNGTASVTTVFCANTLVTGINGGSVRLLNSTGEISHNMLTSIEVGLVPGRDGDPDRVHQVRVIGNTVHFGPDTPEQGDPCIGLSQTHGSVLIDNQLQYCETGISVTDCFGTVIEGNTISDSDTGISVYSTPRVRIARNSVAGLGDLGGPAGIGLSQSDGAEAYRNNAEGHVIVHQSSHCLIEGNVTGFLLLDEASWCVYRANKAGNFNDHLGTNNISHGDNYMPGQM